MTIMLHALISALLYMQLSPFHIQQQENTTSKLWSVLSQISRMQKKKSSQQNCCYLHVCLYENESALRPQALSLSVRA